MRLNAPITSKSVGDVDGLRADIVEKILGTAERKRSRPTSSLDVKVDRLKQTIPPSRKQQQTSQRTSQRKTTSPVTRARRGGGIPPKFDFSQLEGLTEEELRLALAQDPELAAAVAAAAAEKEMFATQKRKSPYYRNKDGRVKSINDYPAHLRSMMEDGIPVKQWIILLILLGAGLYQLRKNMFTTRVEKSSKKIMPPKKASRKVGNKRGKRIISPAVKEKDAFQSVPAPDEKSPPPLQEEESAGLDNEKETSMTDAKKAKASTKKKLKPTSKKVQPDKTTKDESLTADQEKSRQSPDYSASTNGSSAAELVVVDSEERGALGSVEPLSHVRDESEGDDEWQTVGKGSAAEKSQSKNGNKIQNAAFDPATNDAVDDVTNATTIPDVTENAAETTTAKPTKKKKNKNKSANILKSAAPEVLSTQDDEALAMKLQQQEEKLAEADSRATSEDIWASVTPKKSKRKGPTETSGTDTSLAEIW